MLTNATGAALEAEAAEGRRYNERWVHFPNHAEFDVTSRWCSRAPLTCDKSGDPRAAMAPLLARRYLGDSFKWLVYGDVSSLQGGCGGAALARWLQRGLPSKPGGSILALRRPAPDPLPCLSRHPSAG